MFKILSSVAVAIALLSLTPAAEQAAAQEPRVVTPKRRPQIVITQERQRLSASAKRHCEAELVQEYRPSGTVIVPRTICWWQN